MTRIKMNNKKPTEIKPNTPITRATMSRGKLRENNATATVHKDSNNTHSKSEPSCPPHTAANW